MKVVSAVSVAGMIEAFKKNDEQKFFAYANFIADAFDEAGEKRSARIVRSRIDGSYKDQAKVVLDSAGLNI